MGVKQNGVKLFLKERSYTCKNKVHIRSSKTFFFHEYEGKMGANGI